MARGLLVIVLVALGRSSIAIPLWDIFERAVAPKCWYYDGTLARDFNYTPNPAFKTGFAPCCDQSEGDEFLGGGLCWFPSSPKRGAYIYRGACTDQSWHSDRCAQVCIKNTPNFWEALLFCSRSSTFCCQKSIPEGSCCDDDTLAIPPEDLPKFPDHVMVTLSSLAVLETATGTVTPATEIATDSLITSITTSVPALPTSESDTAITEPPSAITSRLHTSSSNTTPIAPPTNSPTGTNPNNNNESEGLSEEAKIGLAVGIPSLIATVVATIVVCYRRPQFVHNHVTNPTKVHVVDPIKKWWG